MKIERLAIPDLVLLEPQAYPDARGAFFESWNRDAFVSAIGHAPDFVQDNQSVSQRGVVRGLHYQTAPFAQGKLVRAVHGAVFDVAVDLRLASSTYGQWAGATLSAENRKQLWIPPGFAHGFMALTDEAVFLYKVAGAWSRAHERSLRWDDNEIGIVWPDAGMPPILSEKDAIAPTWAETVADIAAGKFDV